MVCATVRPGETIDYRFVHLIAHEYAHVEQPKDEIHPTVLSQSLKEGVAQLIAELTSGRIGNSYLPACVRGRERAVGEHFLKEANETDLSKWLDNGVGTPEKPGI